MTASSAAESIADGLARVQRRLSNACFAASRPRDAVKLVAVSKKMPVAAIRAAYALGQRDFGENYAQELRQKAEDLADLDGLRWHFIGPLQRNKAQYVVGTAALIHSVASVSLVERIEQLAAAHGIVQDVLVQVSLAGESSKSGITRSQLDGLLACIADTTHVRCVGLMTMPPYFERADLAAPLFAQLRELRDERRPAMPSNCPLDHLSMGMSHDVEVAVAEGATLVRIGTAIFGARPTIRA